MASKATPNEARIHLDSRDITRIFLVLAGGAILMASLITPWWTRGFTEDFSKDDNPRGVDEFYEGFYVQYRPFHTPGSLAGVSSDAGRETATAVLGIALVLCTVFVLTATLLRLGMRMNWVETSHDAPVRFAIAAFVLGIFAVVWAAFFLPLLGPNPGWLYGNEADVTLEEQFELDEPTYLESTRYANVGFFLGIIGAVGFPAYMWADAARERSAAGTSATTRSSRASPTF